MKRFVAILVFAAAVLVVTHVLAPAEPTPAAAVVPRDLAAIGQAAPLVDRVDAEVKRLQQRLAATPAYPAPSRNPFQFGKRTDRPTGKEVIPRAESAHTTPPRLPRLVAITSTGPTDGARRSAVFAQGDSVTVLASGDAIGALVVRDVTDGGVDLFDPATGTTYHLSLE